MKRDTPPKPSWSRGTREEKIVAGLMPWVRPIACVWPQASRVPKK